jgi:hypothetical protein
VLSLLKQKKYNMVTNEQFIESFLKVAEEIKALKLRVSELESKAVPTYTAKAITETTDEETKSYPSVEDAPEWKLVFKVNTSEGISTQKVIQKAWTEKQAIFLGRTEQLFSMMNELVKAKQIQAKWSIAESTAEKIV